LGTFLYLNEMCISYRYITQLDSNGSRSIHAGPKQLRDWQSRMGKTGSFYTFLESLLVGQNKLYKLVKGVPDRVAPNGDYVEESDFLSLYATYCTKMGERFGTQPLKKDPDIQKLIGFGLTRTETRYVVYLEQMWLIKKKITTKISNTGHFENPGSRFLMFRCTFTFIKHEIILLGFSFKTQDSLILGFHKYFILHYYTNFISKLLHIYTNYIITHLHNLHFYDITILHLHFYNITFTLSYFTCTLSYFTQCKSVNIYFVLIIPLIQKHEISNAKYFDLF
jgi:hypothetical protein